MSRNALSGKYATENPLYGHHAPFSLPSSRRSSPISNTPQVTADVDHQPQLTADLDSQTQLTANVDRQAQALRNYTSERDRLVRLHKAELAVYEAEINSKRERLQSLYAADPVQFSLFSRASRQNWLGTRSRPARPQSTSLSSSPDCSASTETGCTKQQDKTDSAYHVPRLCEPLSLYVVRTRQQGFIPFAN